MKKTPNVEFKGHTNPELAHLEIVGGQPGREDSSQDERL